MALIQRQQSLRKQAPLQFVSPRYIFACADLHISPPGFVCTLQPPGLVECASQNLQLLHKRQSVHPCSGPDHHVIHFIVITNACPQQTCLFGLQISPLRFLSQFLHHLLQVRLPVRKGPAVVRPSKAAQSDDLLLGMSQGVKSHLLPHKIRIVIVSQC